MPLTVTVSTIAVFLRTVCNILEDNKKKLVGGRNLWIAGDIAIYCIQKMYVNFRMTILQKLKTVPIS